MAFSILTDTSANLPTELVKRYGISDTPFSFFVKRKIRRLARGIHLGKSEVLKVTMPISKKMFLSASTSYWLRRGEKNGIDLNQMSTMEIESNTTLE